MGATFVVDASVVVDVLAPGSDSADSERLVAGMRWVDPITLMAPDILFLEAANAFRKMSLRRAISPAGADSAVQALDRLPIASVPCSSVLESAWSLSGNLTVYDASYLALARDLDVPYVTRDRRAVQAGAGARVRAWHVSDPELVRLLDSLGPPKSGIGEIT